MLYGLRESLNILSEERLSRVFERHQVLAEGVRAAVKAWGLRLLRGSPVSWRERKCFSGMLLGSVKQSAPFPLFANRFGAFAR